jgi:hypothetical protein
MTTPDPELDSVPERCQGEIRSGALLTVKISTTESEMADGSSSK